MMLKRSLPSSLVQKRSQIVNSLFLKTLYDKRWFVVGWSLGLGFLGFVMMTFYPAFNDTNGLDELLKNIPPALQGLVGDLANLKTISGYLGGQLFEVRMTIIVSIMAIILALGLTASEEDKGELRTLLTTPLSRIRIVVEKFLALALILLVCVASVIIGIYLGVWSIGEVADLDVILQLVGASWLFAVAVGSIVFGIGLASGKRGLTVAIGTGIVVGSFLLSTFAKAVDWLEPYTPLAITHYFPAETIALEGIQWMDMAVLVGITLAMLSVALICFRSRDVG